MRKKARKMMYNENGVAYAPWAARSFDEDALVQKLIQKEKFGDAPTKRVSILDRGEVETSEGMRWRMNSGQVELAWVTGGEEENQGFIVVKRPSYGGDFQEIASFREVSALVSKGGAGGRYIYSDPSTAAGSWVYRVMDCENNDESNMLCQCFVEVQSENDSKLQTIAAAGFAALLVGAAIAGYALDPPR